MRTAILLALSLGAASGGEVRVDPALPSYAPAGQVPGAIDSTGARNLETMMVSWAAAFQRIHPEAVVRVHGVGLSSEGFEALIDGQAQLAPFAREASPTEDRDFQQRFGYAPLMVCVATGSYATKFNTHALGIFVNAANPLTRLTLPQLDAIFSSTRRRGYPEDLTRWGQVGLTGAWTDRPIHPYGMVMNYKKTGNPPGIVYFFTQRVLLGGGFKPTLHQVVDTTPGRLDLTAGSDVNPTGKPKDAPQVEALDGIVEAVAKDPAGIGFSGFRNAKEGAKTVALAEGPGAPFYSGTPEEVLRREYPLSRKVYVAVNRPPGKPLDPLVREFLRFALSREGQEIVARDPSHYLPLTAAVADEARRMLE